MTIPKTSQLENPIILIDGEALIAPSCYAFNNEHDVFDSVRDEIKNKLNTIRARIPKATKMVICLGGKGNFRYTVVSDYKANRKDKPKPKFWNNAKEFLIKHKASVFDTMEADDALALLAYRYRSLNLDYIICGVDKDLRQIPGDHYILPYNSHGKRFGDEFLTVNEYQGAVSKYCQTLVGDTADNIKGVPGIGKVKALKALEGIEIDELSITCLILYYNNGLTFDDFIISYKLVKLLTTEVEITEKDYTIINLPNDKKS